LVIPHGVLSKTWQMLVTSHHSTEQEPLLQQTDAYIVCTQVCLCSEEIARLGDWVLVNLGPDGMQPEVAQVMEIWQCVGLINHQQGCVNGILIEHHLVGCTHEIYEMPLLKTDGWSIITMEVREPFIRYF